MQEETVERTDWVEQGMFARLDSHDDGTVVVW